MEARQADLSTRENANTEEREIQGIALTFDSPTTLYTDEYGNEYKEVIHKNALDDCDLSDVVLRYNHNDILPVLARTTNGSLSLSITDYGLEIKANIADTTTGLDIYKQIENRAINKMSIGFVVGESTVIGNTRHILSIQKLIDVSVVDFPAYANTYVDVVREIQLQKLRLQTY